MKRLFYGWWVVISCGIISLWGGGVFYSISGFIKPIVEEFGWSYLSISLAVSLRNVELGLIAPAAGFLTDRFGPRVIISSSALITGVGLGLLSQMNSLGMFYIGVIILAIGLSGYSQVVTTAAIANWFDKKMGRATGIALAGYGAGGILMPFVVWLIGDYGWRVSLILLGASTCLVLIPAALLLRHKPEQYGCLPDGGGSETLAGKQIEVKKTSRVETDFPTGEVVRMKVFWFLGLAFAVQVMIFGAVTIHIMPYLSSAGLPEGSAALVAMFIPLSSIPGRLSFGWLGDIFDKRHLLTAALFLQAIGLVFFCYGSSIGPLIAFLSFFGPASGGAVALISAILREYFGRSAFGSIQGLITAVMTVGAIFGPAYAGWMFDFRGGYEGAWVTFAAGLLAVVPVILTIKNPMEKPEAAKKGFVRR